MCCGRSGGGRGRSRIIKNEKTVQSLSKKVAKKVAEKLANTDKK